MNTIKLECPNCKAPLNVERRRSQMFCEYCGTKIAIDDLDLYKEDAKTERFKSVVTSIDNYANKVTELSHERKTKREENKVRNALLSLAFFVLAIIVWKLV